MKNPFDIFILFSYKNCAVTLILWAILCTKCICVRFHKFQKKSGLLMLPSPNSTYDYPSFMTKGCLFCTWYHSSCAFFVYHLRDCGMALLVLRENGNLLEKRSTLTSIPTYIYNLCITNLKVTSFFFLVPLPTTYFSNCKHFDRFIGENCNFWVHCRCQCMR